MFRMPLAAPITLLLALEACVAHPPAQPFPPVPPLLSESQPPQPLSTFGQMIWQPGHWLWTGADYAWQPGQWVPLGDHSTTWMPGHWLQVPPGGWAWQPAHWL